jgi:hypothetical protein
VKTWSTSVVIGLISLTVIPLAALGDDGWKMPNLNPFAGNGKPPTTGRVASAPTSGWQWPKLGQASPATKSKPKAPSTWQKMTTGTQKLMSQTADALNPFDDAAKTTKQPPKPSGSNSAIRRASAKKDQKNQSSSSILPSSWWGGQEKPTEPKTVTDFLSQKRPGF